MGDMIALETAAAIVQQELAASFPGRRVLGIWMYGSRARDAHRPDSDIDLAVLCDAQLDPADLFDASGRLAARLGAPVDLVDLRRAGGLLRVEATHRGKPLTPPTTEADLFTAHALSDHAAFAPNRRAATRAFEERYRGR
jgi:predicted nucleotidyltransferase